MCDWGMMGGLFSNWGLKGRALAFCVLLLSGTGLALSGSLIWQQHRATRRETLEKTRVHAQSLSQIAESAVLLNDAKAMHQVVAVGANADEFAMAAIVNPQGKVLARYQRSPSFRPETDISPAHLASQVWQKDSARAEWSSNQLAVIVPIFPLADDTDIGIIEEESQPAAGKPIAHLILIYSLEELHVRLAKNIVVSILLSGLVIAVGITVTIITVRQMLRPLETLTRTAGAIAMGDMSQRAPETAVAEIGDLARSFNHMADRIRQYTEGLEAQVSKRTAELSEALHRAEAATLAKSEFLANMSHEIRTPMTAILGYTDILIEQSWGRDAQEPLAVVKRNGEYLLQIINDILDLSKIESGKLEVERIRSSPTQLIAEVRSLMRVRIEAKNLTMKIQYATELPETIQTDPTRARQILINLMGNAIKFTEKGEVRLAISFVRSAAGEILDLLRSHRDWWNENAVVPAIREGDPYLRFDIIDTGIGIAPEMLHRLFEPFTQADNSMSRRYGGTGLGLTISRRLAQRLGGTILVQSALGKGSTFSLIIPTGPLDGVRMNSSPDDQVITGCAPTPATSPTDQLDCRILLAEDRPDNQRLISLVLRKAGAEVDIAENGRVAVEMVRSAGKEGKSYDIVLMDMQMPVLDGYGAVGQLRNMGYDKPVIALTAHAMSGDRDQCLAVGCTDYATKPIDRALLLKTISKYVPRRAHATQEVPEPCGAGKGPDKADIG